MWFAAAVLICSAVFSPCRVRCADQNPRWFWSAQRTLLESVDCQETAHAVAQRIAAAKTLVANLAASEFDKVTADFDLTMRLLLPPAQLRAAWEAMSSAYGSFQKIIAARAEEKDGYVVIVLTLEFTRGKFDTKVVYKQSGRIAGLFFVPQGKYQPPKYVCADSFDEVEIKVGEGFFPLSGTLSMPKGKGAFPAVVLVHGSGPNDRDETIGSNKPFRDLAHGLASRGIAVLRYEKRTRQYPLNMLLLNKLTVKEETIDDATAATDALAAHDKIDPKRIFVLGHSLGGMLIPRIAAANKKPAGFISLAGSTRPLEDLILEQVSYLLSLDNPPVEAQQKKIDELRQQIARVKSAELSNQTLASELPLGIPASYWLDLRDYDPAVAAQKIDKPLLILQGERDYQVTMADFARWKSALEAHPRATCLSYPQLNHLFIAGQGKSSPAEYFTPGNVAAAVIDDVAAWVQAQR